MKKVKAAFRGIVIFLLCVIEIYPLFWMLTASFKKQAEWSEKPAYALNDGFYFQNYSDAWTRGHPRRGAAVCQLFYGADLYDRRGNRNLYSCLAGAMADCLSTDAAQRRPRLFLLRRRGGDWARTSSTMRLCRTPATGRKRTFGVLPSSSTWTS